MHKELQRFGRVKVNELLKKHTTFKVGGPAAFLVIVEDTDKLVGLLDFLTGEGARYLIVGGGSNLLASDEEFDGVVIKVKTEKCEVQDDVIIVDAGALLSTVVNLAVKNGLAGMEWGMGIPGTIGGAVRGNAGAMGEDMSGVLQSVEVWRDGEVLHLGNDKCGFGYRDSAFKKNSDVVLRARLKLRPAPKAEILALMQKNAAQRAGRVSPLPSAGSFFKNIKTESWQRESPKLEEVFHQRGKIPAGWLIEQAGCAKLKHGEAEVSDLHANIIVNRGGASSSDIKNLVEEIKQTVYNKFGVQLEEEVEIIK